MKKFISLLCIIVIIFGLSTLSFGAKYTRHNAVYGKSGGLSYDAVYEALQGYQFPLSIPLLQTPEFGGTTKAFEINRYIATAEADGAGGFTIDSNLPALSYVLYVQSRVDVALTGTATNWDLTVGSGGQEVCSNQAFTQNTKCSAFYDPNANSPVLSAETDLYIVPDSGNITEGFITAVVYVLEATDLADTVAMSFSGETFSEDAANDGTIDNTTPVTITLTGETFTGNASDDFVDDGKVVVTNLPEGLTVVATRTSETVLTLTITGTATDHNNADDVTTLTLTFQDSAFGATASEIINYAKADLTVDFSAPVLAYSGGTFGEAIENDGSIDNSTPITITLAGDVLTGENSDDFVDEGKIVVSNLSTGLTAVATRTSSTILSVTLTGNASAHADANDVADLTFTFQNTAFTNSDASEVTNYAKADLAIDYDDPPELAYSASTFTEHGNNDGTIDNSTPVVITLTGETFTGSDTDDFVDGGKIVVTNLPANLVAVATRTSSTTLSVTLTGAATSHANADDVSDLTFTFQDSAFTNVAASDITNYAKSDLAIDFSD
jgi:hypothetical protein